MIKRLNGYQNGFGALPVIVGVLTLLVLGLSGYIVFNNAPKTNNIKTNSSATQESSIERTAEAVENKVIDKYAGWKTYTTSGGLSFQYPTKYTATAFGDSVMLTSTAKGQTQLAACQLHQECYESEFSINVGIFTQNGSESHAQTLSRNGYDVSGMKQSKVSTHSTYESKDVYTNEAFGGYGYNCFVLGEGKIYNFSANFENIETGETYKQILSTVEIK